MDTFAKIMSTWEHVLNADAELEERNKSTYSSLEGKTAIQLAVDKLSPYSVDVAGGKFKVHQGSPSQPLLSWKLSGDLFKDAMLGKHRLIFSLLDPRGQLSFDTPNFTHWNGASIIEMLLLAQEMTIKSPEIAKLVKELE
ncbi:MAG: hypothetical protein NTZ51_09365 [Proteobacteria bacterium]|nr:hypothetical protein [Pseudomonadota bacterium]